MKAVRATNRFLRDLKLAKKRGKELVKIETVVDTISKGQQPEVDATTQANYSSLRAGKIEFRRLCEQVQYGMLIPMLVRPIAERFHAQGALVGLWVDAMPKGVAHVPPAHEMIDPLKDTTALIAQVRAGLGTF